MKIDLVRDRLSALPDPLPQVPRVVGPVAIGQIGALPYVTRARGSSGRRAAALLLIYPDPQGEAIFVATERGSRGLRHPGEISLPGGAEDATDDVPIGTALREAVEEVGLDPEAAGLEFIGLLDVVDVRVSRFLLTPVVAICRRAPKLQPAEAEVAAILHVPVDVIIREDAIETVEEQRDGYRLRYGAYHFEEHRIWGATARVLAQLAAVLSS